MISIGKATTTKNVFESLLYRKNIKSTIMKELEEIFDEVNGHGKFQRLQLYVVFGPVFAFLPLV